MKNSSTYRLLIQSEEKTRNILETGLYALFALSAVTSIWQFAQQTNSLPLDRVGTVIERAIDQRGQHGPDLVEHPGPRGLLQHRLEHPEGDCVPRH